MDDLSSVPTSKTPDPGQPKDTPPQTPPSPDANDSDVRASRKREREVSVELATTPKAIDIDPQRQSHHETRTPKKNRIHLETTEEEEDSASRSRSRSQSVSPPPCGSPPQEMKMRVRQISQGVEDLSWKRNSKGDSSEGDIEVDGQVAPTDNDDLDDGFVMVSADSPSPETTQMNVTSGQTPPESVPSSQMMESIAEGTPNSTQSSPDIPAQTTIQSRRDSESDSGEKDKGLKRKFLERGTSQGPQDESSKTRVEPLKRARDATEKDENPRETKRPTPPPEAVVEPLKRPREDSDKDDNPRETKRPSPPPEKMIEIEKPAPKLTGFMAYASASSPFASVKGQNVFASSSTKSPPLFSSSSTVSSPFVLGSGEASSSSLAVKPTAGSQSSVIATKRTGFEAFASSSSPFAAVARSKSPVLGSTSQLGRNRSPVRRANPADANAFSSYASGGVAHGFSLPVTKRARAGSPSGGSSRSSLERNPIVKAFGSGDSPDSGAEDENDSRAATFGEKLRAGKDDEDEASDDEPKITLTEQEFTTGEEDEETVHQVRGKLFSLSSLNQWKERGTGTLKLNVRKLDGGGARLVMRKEAVYTVLLNVTLFRGMRCSIAQDPRYVRFSVIESGATTHYNLRVSSAKIAQELLEEINANIPTD